MGVSSGTLRMLALMTALHGEPSANLVGIEEPENYVHPSALSSFVEYLLEKREQVQMMITTHSPLLLDFLGDPAAVSVVRRSDNGDTTVARETNPDGVRRALEASGFGLGGVLPNQRIRRLDGVDKRVVIVASGETERRALPHLAFHLRACGVSVSSVLIPPGNRALSVEMAEKLIKAAWYEDLSAPPDKFVLLLDLDQAEADEVLSPFGALPERLGAIHAPILYAYAKPHLEGWYFADSLNLRNHLGRSLGSIDTSKPDEINNPKATFAAHSRPNLHVQDI